MSVRTTLTIGFSLVLFTNHFWGVILVTGEEKGLCMDNIQQIAIIGNGEDWKKEKIVHYCRKADFIMAADNGLSLLHQLKTRPNLIIGDFDSVPASILNHYQDIPREEYPADKDLSDSELCLRKAIQLKSKAIDLLAMTGNYFDHSYATIVNLFRNNYEEININVITSNATIFPVSRDMVLNHVKGRRFSLFPLTAVSDFSMKGAQYNLSKSQLSIMDYSLSNVIISEKLTLHFQKGLLFCVLFDPGYR